MAWETRITVAPVKVRERGDRTKRYRNAGALNSCIGQLLGYF